MVFYFSQYFRRDGTVYIKHSYGLAAYLLATHGHPGNIYSVSTQDRRNMGNDARFIVVGADYQITCRHSIYMITLELTRQKVPAFWSGAVTGYFIIVLAPLKCLQ